VNVARATSPEAIREDEMVVLSSMWLRAYDVRLSLTGCSGAEKAPGCCATEPLDRGERCWSVATSMTCSPPEQRARVGVVCRPVRHQEHGRARVLDRDRLLWDPATSPTFRSGRFVPGRGDLEVPVIDVLRQGVHDPRVIARPAEGPPMLAVLIDTATGKCHWKAFSSPIPEPCGRGLMPHAARRPGVGRHGRVRDSTSLGRE